MYSSKYADPPPTSTTSPTSKPTKPSIDLGSGRGLNSSQFAHESPSPNEPSDIFPPKSPISQSLNGLPSPKQEPDAQDDTSSTLESKSSTVQSPSTSTTGSNKIGQGGPDTSKELPPVPSSAEPTNETITESNAQTSIPLQGTTQDAQNIEPPTTHSTTSASHVADSKPTLEVITQAPSTEVKTKRSKAGKMCPIKLPSDKSKTYSGYPIPMSRDEVKARLEKFESDGLDTRGFGLLESSESRNSVDISVQARPEFPSPLENRQDRTQREVQVSIPNKIQWNEYVKRLTEEKLRALGVTSDDDNDRSPQPFVRHGSSPFLPPSISPPVPSSSSASQHLWQNNMPFSAPFSPASSTNNTSIGTVMSPAPQLGVQVHPSHVPRQSTFGFGHSSGPTPVSLQQYQWPGQQLVNSSSSVGRASPALLKRQQSAFSHRSPDFVEGHHPTPRTNSAPRPSSNPSWRSTSQPQRTQTPENNNTFDNNTKIDSLIDVASPKPRGHSHNISANLEREAENAQYYPGEYVNEDLEEDQAGIAKTPAAGTSQTGVVESETMKQSRDKFVGGVHRPAASRNSNTSASSRLNVAAKEFKFNPEASHNRNFSMSNDAFMPSSSKAAKTADATSSVQFATAHSHQGSVSLSNLNVAAPEFKPPAQKNFAFSSSWFNFSARKPSEAAKAAADAGKDSPVEDKERATTFGSKIFGNLADIVKPAKKSKAVPIVNPDDIADTQDESDLEDEDGRIVQSDSRRKKGRFMADDGDEIPRFAEPTPEPGIEPPVKTDTKLDVVKPGIAYGRPEENPKSPIKTFDLHEDLDMEDALSDGSNVPWHELSSDARQDNGDATPSARPQDLLSSPIPASGFEDSPRVEDISDISSQHSAAQKSLSHNSNREEERSLLYPSFQEIDAVMDYINQDNSDFGVEEQTLPEPHQDLISDTLNIPNQNNQGQSDIQSSGFEASERQVFAAQDDKGHDAQEPNEAGDDREIASPVEKLSQMAEPAASDWDDMLSPGEELKIPQQTNLSDAHIANLVKGLLQKHLSPFEQQMKELSASIQKSSNRDVGRIRPISAYEMSDSDADDEDDTERQLRFPTRDMKSDKRMEHLRSVVMDAVAASQPNGLGQIEQEVQFRKAAEARADDLQRQLMLAQNEISGYKQATQLSEEKIRSLEQEREALGGRHRAVEEELRTKTLDFTTEIASLENTLDEYRTSSVKGQEQVELVSKEREALQKTIDAMRSESEGSHQEISQVNEKLTKLQEELSQSSTQYTSERSTWEINKEKQAQDIENLQAKLKDASQHRERLEKEVSRLSEIEKNSIKTGVMLEETQNSKRKLEVMVNKLNEKTIEHRTIVAHYEREASEAHENTSVQVERTKALLKTDVEIANKKVENVRADLETRLQMAKSELENVRKDHDAVRARYEKSLNEANLGRKEALQEATNNHNTRLEEERARFERSLEELSSQHDRSMRNSIEDKHRSESHLNDSLKLANEKIAHLEEVRENLEEKLTVAQSAAQAAALAAQSAKHQKLPATTESITTSLSTPAHLEKVSPQALRESIVVLQEQLQERESRIELLEADISSIGRDAPEKLRERDTEISWLREVLGVRMDDLSDLVNNLQMEKFDRGAARNAAIRIKANLQMEQQEKERQLQGGNSASTQGGALPGLADLQNLAAPRATQLSNAFNSWRKSGPSSTLASIKDAINSGPPSRPPPPSKKIDMAARLSASAASANEQQATEAPPLRNPIAAAASVNANKPSPPFQTGLMTPPASNLRRSPSAEVTASPEQDVHPPKGSTEPTEPKTPIRSRPSTRSHGNSNERAFGGSPTTPDLMRNRDYDLDAELGAAALEFEGSADHENDPEITAEQTRLEPLGEVVASPTKS